jgi:hypothetical protein
LVLNEYPERAESYFIVYPIAENKDEIGLTAITKKSLKIFMEAANITSIEEALDEVALDTLNKNFLEKDEFPVVKY